MSGTSCCGAMAGSCFCGVIPGTEQGVAGPHPVRVYVDEVDLSRPGVFESALTPERRAALAHIGFDEIGQTEGLTDEDAIQILAFHKFLEAGTWKDLPADQKVCRTCGQGIHMDVQSGFWMHDPPYQDGKNGFYCYAVAWENPAQRTNAFPDDKTRKVFEVDQASFEYATGVMDAWEYLESELGSAKNEDPEKNEAQ